MSKKYVVYHPEDGRDGIVQAIREAGIAIMESAESVVPNSLENVKSITVFLQCTAEEIGLIKWHLVYNACREGED